MVDLVGLGWFQCGALPSVPGSVELVGAQPEGCVDDKCFRQPGPSGIIRIGAGSCARWRLLIGPCVMFELKYDLLN
jgi:hypothetical protein